MLVSSLPLFLVMRSGVGSAGGLVVYRVALRSAHSHVRFCRSIVLSDFALSFLA